MKKFAIPFPPNLSLNLDLLERAPSNISPRLPCLDSIADDTDLKECHDASPQNGIITDRIISPAEAKIRCKNIWSTEEDKLLTEAIQLYGSSQWMQIAAYVGSKNNCQCRQRYEKVIFPNIKKGKWTDDEDELLTKAVLECNEVNWRHVSNRVPNRTAKQCRERWKNFLSPNVSREPFTTCEDEVLLSLYGKLGSKWASIARELPGRTENTVKSRFRQLIAKKTLIETSIDCSRKRIFNLEGKYISKGSVDIHIAKRQKCDIALMVNEKSKQSNTNSTNISAYGAIDNSSLTGYFSNTTANCDSVSVQMNNYSDDQIFEETLVFLLDE